MTFILISLLLVGLVTAAPTTNWPVGTEAPTQSPSGGQTSGPSGSNTWTEGEYTFIINDESNGQVPADTIQNQKDMFFALYPGLAAQYSNAPTTVTLVIDPSTPSNGAGAGTDQFTLSSQHL